MKMEQISSTTSIISFVVNKVFKSTGLTNCATHRIFLCTQNSFSLKFESKLVQLNASDASSETISRAITAELFTTNATNFHPCATTILFIVNSSDIRHASCAFIGTTSWSYSIQSSAKWSAVKSQTHHSNKCHVLFPQKVFPQFS